MNAPNVTSFAAHDKEGRPVRFTVSMDIVDYMESAETFGREHLADPLAEGRFERRMVALPDKRSAVVTPLVLTLSSQNGLYLVRREDGSRSGSGEWTLADLTEAFRDSTGATRPVRAFGVGWTDDDRIAVAVAVDDDSSGRSRVFVAYDLSSRTSNWGNIAWQDCGVRDDIRVQGLRVLDDGDGHWTVVLAGDRGPNDLLYLLSSQREQRFDRATVFNPAVDLEDILDFEVVRHPVLGGGIAVLGASGGTRDLSFRAFPTQEIPVPAIVPLPCPEGANVLETGCTRKVGRHGTRLGTDLYIGGQGIQLIPAAELYNQSEARVIQVAGPQAARDVQDVMVGEAADGGSSVWALLQNGGLVVVRREAAREAAWGTPLRLRGDVQQIAPVHCNGHATTAVLVVYADGRACTIWQDASTGVWNEAPLSVANPNQVAQVTCYGTSLRCLDQDGIPQPGKPVKVSASTLASVVVNGRTAFIGPGLEVEATTDMNGGISLYDRVRSLTPAVYRFAPGDLDDCIDVNPATGAHQRLGQITADELRTAQVAKAGGGTESLLGTRYAAGGPDTSRVDGIAAALHRASTLAMSMKGCAAPGVSRVAAGSAFSSTLQNSTLPDDFRVGIKSTASGVQTLDSAAISHLIDSTSRVEDFFSDLGDSIVDFLEGVVHRVEDGLEFVIHKVHEGFRFICKIGAKIRHFVLETLEQIGGFFTWLWEQVETGLEKLWNFLKFLFEWDDIVTTRDVLVKVADEALLYVQSSVGDLKHNVATGFDQAVHAIRQWQTELDVPLPAQPGPGTSLSALLQTATDSKPGLLDRIMGNSVVGWVLERLTSVLDEIVDVQLPEASAEARRALADFWEWLTGGGIAPLLDIWDQIEGKVSRIFCNGLPGNEGLGVETIKHLIVTVGGELVVGLLQGARELMLRFVDLLTLLTDVARMVTFAKISFPFVEKLVELVSPGKHLDTSFRLIDGIALLGAIPGTIAYKLIFGEAPFKNAVVNLPWGRVTVQSGLGGSLGGTSLARTATGVSAFIKALQVVQYSGMAMTKPNQEGKGASAAPWLEFLARTLLVCGVLGFTTEVATMHRAQREERGDNVLLIYEMLAAMGSWLTAIFSSWHAWVRIAGMEKLPETDKVLGGAAIVCGAVQIVFNALAFSEVVRLAERKQKAPESLRFVGRMTDHVGTIVFNIAIMGEKKPSLCKAGAYLKGFSMCCAISQLIVLGIQEA